MSLSLCLCVCVCACVCLQAMCKLDCLREAVLHELLFDARWLCILSIALVDGDHNRHWQSRQRNQNGNPKPSQSICEQTGMGTHTHCFTLSLLHTRSFTHSLLHSFTHAPSHTHSFTPSLLHSLTFTHTDLWQRRHGGWTREFGASRRRQQRRRARQCLWHSHPLHAWH